MKFIAIIISLCTFSSSWASSVVWEQQEIQKIYQTTKVIELKNENKKILIPIGSSFELYEKSKLNMIKVYLYKYTFSKCEQVRMETDLELITLSQPSGSSTSVGINLSKGCKVEVFVDFDDYSTLSFFE